MKIKVLAVLLMGFTCMATNNFCLSLDADAVAKQLQNLEKTIPLPYDDALIKGIRHYESIDISGAFVNNESFLEMELQRRNMPIELKYIPLALSNMRSDYTCGDCRGFWALPTLVALHYGLVIDENHDERLSIESSTKAALDYFSDLYQIYHDWWLCILAFSNSPNALQSAIVQNDKFLDLWDFYQQKLLPNSQIISDFIACIYVYQSYTTEQKTEALAQFEALEAKRLADEAKKEQEQMLAQADSTLKTKPTNTEKPKANYSTYTVKKGDCLSTIAKKQHVSVGSLKKWNNLKSDFIREGQKLKIKK